MIIDELNESLMWGEILFKFMNIMKKYWLDGLLYLIIYTLICAFIPTNFYDYIFSVNLGLYYLPSVIISLISCIILFYILEVLFGIYQPLYPRFWTLNVRRTVLVMIGGVNVFYFFSSYKISVNSSYTELNLIILTAYLLVSFVVIIRQKIASKDKSKNNLTNVEACSVLKDIPVGDVKGDKFNFKQLAKKLAKQIDTGDSISLVGSYGSGKSTLTNLALSRIVNKGSIVICKIDSWGRNENKFPELLLKNALQKLNKEWKFSRLSICQMNTCMLWEIIPGTKI